MAPSMAGYYATTSDAWVTAQKFGLEVKIEDMFKYLCLVAMVWCPLYLNIWYYLGLKITMRLRTLKL